jgi:predicted DNA-binding protein (UPF0251 family)
MGRRQLWRRVSYVPQVGYFKPVGIPLVNLEEIRLLVEEIEAIRLKDFEGLEGEECAQRMNISRTTFSRVLESGRKKLANALLNGKAIRIEGGNFELSSRRFRCISGHEWEVPFDRLVSSPPQICPQCDTPSIMPLVSPGMGWGRGGRGRSSRKQMP